MATQHSGRILGIDTLKAIGVTLSIPVLIPVSFSLPDIFHTVWQS
jgi:hypothetical protein